MKEGNAGQKQCWKSAGCGHKQKPWVQERLIRGRSRTTEDTRPTGKAQQHLSIMRRKGTANEVREVRREPASRRCGQGQLLPKKSHRMRPGQKQQMDN